MTHTLDFLVKQGDLRSGEFARGEDASQIALAPGGVLLAIDQFALTANNITYRAGHIPRHERH